MIFHGRSSLTGAGFLPRCPRAGCWGHPGWEGRGPCSRTKQARLPSCRHPVSGFPSDHTPFTDKTEDNLTSILSTVSPGA